MEPLLLHVYEWSARDDCERGDCGNFVDTNNQRAVVFVPALVIFRVVRGFRGAGDGTRTRDSLLGKPISTPILVSSRATQYHMGAYVCGVSPVPAPARSTPRTALSAAVR